MDKSIFIGKIISIQPRIRLKRCFDESSHEYLGYAMMLDGELDGQQTLFSIGISKATHTKHQMKVNDTTTGDCLPVPHADLESTQYYKVSNLKVISQGAAGSTSSPWELVPPELEVYRERGRRRLSARTYETKCRSCMWGARMPVEIIIDNWNLRSQKANRFETFCYGPLNCKFYKAGPTRKVEGRHGMVWVEEDWVDEMAVEHRDPDE